MLPGLISLLPLLKRRRGSDNNAFFIYSALSVSPWINRHSLIDGVLTKLSTDITLTQSVLQIEISPNKRYLGLRFNTSPGFAIYQNTNYPDVSIAPVWSFVFNGASHYNSNTVDLKFSPDSANFAYSGGSQTFAGWRSIKIFSCAGSYLGEDTKSSFLTGNLAWADNNTLYLGTPYSGTSATPTAFNWTGLSKYTLTFSPFSIAKLALSNDADVILDGGNCAIAIDTVNNDLYGGTTTASPGNNIMVFDLTAAGIFYNTDKGSTVGVLFKKGVYNGSNAFDENLVNLVLTQTGVIKTYDVTYDGSGIPVLTLARSFSDGQLYALQDVIKVSNDGRYLIAPSSEANKKIIILDGKNGWTNIVVSSSAQNPENTTRAIGIF